MHDPVFAGLTEQIVAVEAALPRERIAEVVLGSFRQLPVARRTLDLIAAQPELLTSADPHTAPALAHLLLRLHKAGAQNVKPPPCAHCGTVRALLQVSPSGRICAPCGRRLTAMSGQCGRCGEARRLQPGPGETAYCKRCWAEMKPGADARIAEEVRRRRRVASAVVGLALEQMDVSARDRRVRLMLEIQIHGDEWFTDPAAGSVLFGTFYDLLRAGGARLPERRCGGCGTTRTLSSRLDGRLSCRRCYRDARRRVCDSCGELAHLERLLADGRRLCPRCTIKLPEEQAACVTCGHRRRIAFRGPDGPVCSTCRGASRIDTCRVCGQLAPCAFPQSEKSICKPCSDLASVDVCTHCGNERQCRWAGSARAVCEQCANPRDPCSGCGEIRLRHKRVEGGGYLCWACTPPIIETCTGCGADRIVNGRVEGRPFCPLCYPQQPESFRPCVDCGTVTRLIGRRCLRCRADRMVREMIPDAVAASDARIAALRERWFQGAPSKIIYAFERGTVACTVITRVLAEPAYRTHAYIDEAGSDMQTRSVRAVLVDHGLLPPRDELLTRFEHWIPGALAEITDPQERQIVTQYARWRHLRALRNDTMPTTAGQLSWRRTEILGIVEFLSWLRSHDISLASLTQTTVDEWLAAGPRPHLHHFLRWSGRAGHSRRLVAPSPRSVGLNPQSMSDDERWRLLADVTSDSTIDSHTKFAAGLMLIFGIRVARIIRLRAPDVTVTEDAVVVRLGAEPLVLPAELAPFAIDAANNRTAPRMFVDSIAQEWIYPGTRAGSHMSADALASRLRRAGIPPRQARTSALIALAQELPPVVLSRLTGLDIAAAIAWSNAMGANNSAYAAEAIDRVGVTVPSV